MILKDISFPDPSSNILYDEVLLQLSEKVHNKEFLRFWESPQYFIVLGRVSSLEDDVRWDPVNKDKILVLRRPSGGGTVLQGKGCLNYSLILSKEKNPALGDLRKSYEIILNKVIEALHQIGINAEFYPISDIALTESLKKISGNAQKRGRKFILHHGTILYNFDLSHIEKYLAMPKDIPEYRKHRKHLDFVDNIYKDVGEVKRTLSKTFGADQKEGVLTEEKELLRNFLETKMVLVSD